MGWFFDRNLARVAVAAAVLALTGATAGANTPAKPDLAPLYNGFGFALFANLERAAPKENVFISPTSVAIALAMTANGAGGSTRTAIMRTLGAQDVSMPSFNLANRSLFEALQNPGEGVAFSLANALWLNAKYSIQPAFVAINRDVFGATAQNVPMGDAAAAETINAWVREHTNGLIPAIVDKTDPLDVAILTNAISMKAKWSVPFEKNATHDAPFHAVGGVRTVSMMANNATLGYASDANWQIARLGYGGTNRFAMYVFLPREGLPLASALHGFDAAAFDRSVAGLHDTYVQFAMPRYTATFKASLNRPLSALGMAAAFGDRADFGNLVVPPAKAWISRVNHRAVVRVDEEGTQAAAATSVEMRTEAIRMPPATKMIVDRPFLIFIRDDRTRQILFLGAIVSP